MFFSMPKSVIREQQTLPPRVLQLTFEPFLLMAHELGYARERSKFALQVEVGREEKLVVELFFPERRVSDFTFVVKVAGAVCRLGGDV